MPILPALSALLVLVSPVDVEQTRPKRPFLSVPEVLKRLEASPRTYGVNALDKLDLSPSEFPARLWPEVVPPVAMPRVLRGKDGKVRVEPWPVPAKAEAMLGAAEDRYQAKDFEGAAAEYRKILAVAPDFYLVEASLGDCALFSGAPSQALAHYDAALRRNPDDYRVHFYRGNALLALKRDDEAVEAFATSLVLKPRNPILWKQLELHAERLGLDLRPVPLAPRAFVRRRGEAVDIYFDPAASHWLGWGSCKALWMGEASHRKEMTGNTEHGWSSVEELECLGGLVTAYLGQREQENADLDPQMERLAAIIRDGLAQALVIHEIASRLDPQIALKVPPAFRTDLRRYVRRYVLGLAR